MMYKTWKVLVEERGESLLSFLKKRDLGAPSVKALKRAIERKQCRLNGRVETFSTHILQAGDVIEIALDFEQNVKKPVLLWEDSDLAAYDKPSGVVSEAKNFSHILVHRLDKETSGVILVAKKRSVFESMKALFQKRAITKKYFAIVDGHIHEREKTIISKMAPQHHFQGQTIYGSDSFGKEAITHLRVVAFGKKSTLVLCRPETGRTHQLRVHLKEIGHPILGDYQYHAIFKAPFHAKRHLLHAYSIDFQHPMQKDLFVRVIAPMPSDFLQALQLLGMAHSIDLLFKEEKDKRWNPDDKDNRLKKTGNV